MKITAITLGSYGDIMPFLLLGEELKKRGHEYRVATFREIEPRVKELGLEFVPISGNADELVSVLLGNSDNTASAGIHGLDFLVRKYPDLYEDFYRAVEGNDAIIYMQFGALAYHFAEKFNIPAIRSMAFPFEFTKKYCAMMDTLKRDTFSNYISNIMCEKMMSFAVAGTVNEFRKKLGLKPWNFFRNYKKMHGKKLLTLYQYDSVMAEPEEKWKKVFLTGNWIKPANKKEEVGSYELDELNQFIDKHKACVYAGFGSMNYDYMDGLYKRILKILVPRGCAVIVPEYVKEMLGNEFEEYRESIYFVKFTPYELYFKKLTAAIHHGGNGTVHACLRNKLPQLVMVFGADQAFWGGQCYHNGLGPKPIFIKKEIDEAEFESKILDLVENRAYKAKSEELSGFVTSDGIKRAADIIEENIWKLTS